MLLDSGSPGQGKSAEPSEPLHQQRANREQIETRRLLAAELAVALTSEHLFTQLAFLSAASRAWRGQATTAASLAKLVPLGLPPRECVQGRLASASKARTVVRALPTVALPLRICGCQVQCGW
jgi:hypothetical protein